MTNPNAPKYYPDLEENVNSSEKNLQNPEKVQQKISEISQNINSKNPEIQENFAKLAEKVAIFRNNNQPIPTAIINILATIEKLPPPTISSTTVQDIFSRKILHS